MHFAHLLVALGTAAVVSSSAVDISKRQVPDSFCAKHHYNAPYPPWQVGAHPGWYFGDYPEDHRDLFCLTPDICDILDDLHLDFLCPDRHKHHHGKGYYQTFHDLTGATEASDYLTYGLVQSVEDCQSMCNTVKGCSFANTYHDVNGKNGSPLLTCALFSQCHDASDAINHGGQTQPDGSVDYIADSAGWCKA
ncbi:hypothetical protein APHAL10511_005475 [Amanita phalloides]|nr:hypothetical protein APHAL10511_005475 [Amanita phalloides]